MMTRSMTWDRTTPIRAVLDFGSRPLAWTKLTDLADQVRGRSLGSENFSAVCGREIFFLPFLPVRLSG